ncbi:MAG: tRNA (adenosine(37)-N6)-dimethylallyltransferase MiaA [Deltaproteobacteria bacterium]|jgi:tRNA dimethylallyltransferase|nr:tRNA (adenosine(37)-N6)-dimethylallyltransferase MiaA [Deltaproteobacteria bacterium]
MRETEFPRPLVVVAGPTGTGKSALGAAVAHRLGGVVVNADSRQVYADFPLITAQPDAATLALAPHRLYAFLPCTEKLNAGAYAALAEREIAEALAAGKLPVLVGGSGLYLQALLSGIAPIPAVDPGISRFWQAECAAKGAQALHALLAERDPQSAGRLHPGDGQRIARALEVLEATGKPLGHWHALPLAPSPYRALWVIVDAPLNELTPRLAARVRAMLDAGAEEEARQALARCGDPAAPGWSGIGCAELFACLAGTIDRETCLERWVHNTRAYAKRQRTWFKRVREALRVSPGEEAPVFTACEAFWEETTIR